MDSDAPTIIEPPADRVGQADDDRPPVQANGPQYGDSFDDWSDAGEAATPVLPGFEVVKWDDLIASGYTSEEILERYKDRLAALKPGSVELGPLYDEMNEEFESAPANDVLDGAAIQLAGFVAPLTFEGDEITEFLLVPYFGACIHVPPPPANQTVIISLAEGESISLEESWGAVWVAGEMTVTSIDTDLATAGYAISDAQFGVYENQ